MPGASCLLKERRLTFKTEIDALGAGFLKVVKFEKDSQLRILKLAVQYFRKEAKFASFDRISYYNSITPFLDQFLTVDYLDKFLNGFIICFEGEKNSLIRRKRFSVSGEIFYISENVRNYFEWNSIDIMLTYDTIFEITSAADDDYFNELCSNPHKYTSANRSTWFANLNVARIKRCRLTASESDYKLFKVTCHYDTRIDAFVALFQPVLNAANRSQLTENDPACFTTTHLKDLKRVDIKCSFNDMLPQSSTLYEMVSPESIEIVSKQHRQVLEKRSSRGSTDLIKLLLKDGSSTPCLLNMYAETSKIVCVYQILNLNDALIYQERQKRLIERNESIQSQQSVDLLMLNSNLTIPNTPENINEMSLTSELNFDFPFCSPSVIDERMIEKLLAPVANVCLKRSYVDDSNERECFNKQARFVDGSNDSLNHMPDLNISANNPDPNDSQDLVLNNREIEKIKNMLKNECRDYLQEQHTDILTQAVELSFDYSSLDSLHILEQSEFGGLGQYFSEDFSSNKQLFL